MTYTTLITTAQLAERLNDPSFVIVDCRFKLEDVEAGRRAYVEAHIPGAVYAHLDYDLSGWKTGANGRHPLPSTQLMIATFSAWGIDSNSQVVAYDDAGGGMGAARLWWMLKYMGHDNVAVLDGGWQAWLAEGGGSESGIVMRTPTEFAGQPREEMRRDADTLGNLTLFDSRAAARYRGEEEPIDRVAGHIPGAKHFFWGGTLDIDGHMLPPDKLREKFQVLFGDTPPHRCVFYCGSGVSSAQNILALEIAGLSGAKLYPGSWSEWSSDPARPIATGQE